MFRLGKRKEQDKIEEHPVVGYVEINGVGRVEVNSVPSAVPSHVMIGNKKVKINRDLYLWLWANLHGTEEGQKKLSAIV